MEMSKLSKKKQPNVTEFKLPNLNARFATKHYNNFEANNNYRCCYRTNDPLFSNFELRTRLPIAMFAGNNHFIK